MARQIIILENQTPNAGATEPKIYKYAMWLSVPVARQAFFSNATATSQVNLGPNLATAAEILAIQNGSIHEVTDTINVAPATTLAQIEATLQAIFTAAQTALNASTANVWDHYGSSFDGTTWTIKTVA